MQGARFFFHTLRHNIYRNVTFLCLEFFIFYSWYSYSYNSGIFRKLESGENIALPFSVPNTSHITDTLINFNPDLIKYSKISSISYDLNMPRCKILRLNTSINVITPYLELKYLSYSKLDCIQDVRVPLTFLESKATNRIDISEQDSNFKIILDTKVLEAYYGGSKNLGSCYYFQILRDDKSNLPDDNNILGEPVYFNTSTLVYMSNLASFQMSFTNVKQQSFDVYLSVTCRDKNNSVIYQNAHIVPARAVVTHYIKTQIKRNLLNEAKLSNNRLNVLLMGVDSTSRGNFERYFDKTYRLLSSLRKNVYSYKGYCKVGDNTYPNLTPLFTGKWVSEEFPHGSIKYFDNLSLIWREYEKRGYASIYLEDEPIYATYNYQKNGFLAVPSNFYFRPFSLEWMRFMNLTKRYDHCSLYGKSEIDMLLDYSESLIKSMEILGQPYFNLNFITKFTHNNLPGAAVIDQLISLYFKRLLEKKLLKNSFIIVFSDHGLRFGKYRETYNGILEDRMPFLLIIPPDNFFNDYGIEESIFSMNTKRIVTAFDIHETLLQLLDIHLIIEEKTPLKLSNMTGNESLKNRDKKGLSLLSMIPYDRDCESAHVPSYYCPCNWLAPITLTTYLNYPKHSTDNISELFQKILNLGADLIVSKIKNDILMPYKKDCIFEEFRLGTIKKFILISKANKRNLEELQGYNANEVRKYLNKLSEGIDNGLTSYISKVIETFKSVIIIIITNPFQGIFEATLDFDMYNISNIFSRVADISRLDGYWDQSYCVNGSEIKKYCYCRKYHN
ncbi:unnamed protein product [Gordionus sp. m RMFG-2023]